MITIVIVYDRYYYFFLKYLRDNLWFLYFNMYIMLLQPIKCQMVLIVKRTVIRMLN